MWSCEVALSSANGRIQNLSKKVERVKNLEEREKALLKLQRAGSAV